MTRNASNGCLVDTDAEARIVGVTDCSVDVSTAGGGSRCELAFRESGASTRLRFAKALRKRDVAGVLVDIADCLVRKRRRRETEQQTEWGTQLAWVGSDERYGDTRRILPEDEGKRWKVENRRSGFKQPQSSTCHKFLSPPALGDLTFPSSVLPPMKKIIQRGDDLDDDFVADDLVALSGDELELDEDVQDNSQSDDYLEEAIESGSGSDTGSVDIGSIDGARPSYKPPADPADPATIEKKRKRKEKLKESKAKVRLNLIHIYL